jgi:3-oxoacyl-[acyl-carrier protein] reductase
MAMVRSSRAAPFSSGPGASILHISSISAYRPSLRSAPYAAVKAAMNSYTGSQAAMLSRQGIRVNAIAPGFANSWRRGPAQTAPIVCTNAR